MAIKIKSSDTSVSKVKNLSALEKITPIKEVIGTRDLPANNLLDNGNNLPDNTSSPKPKPSNPIEDAVDTIDLNEVVKKINLNINSIERKLHFSVEHDGECNSIKIIDLSTNCVVREVQAKDAIRMARKLVDGSELKLFSEYS